MGSQHRHRALSVWVSLDLGARPMEAIPTHRVAGVGPLHFREASHFRVEHIHLLHQGGEGCLCGLAHLLIDTFGLKWTEEEEEVCAFFPCPLSSTNTSPSGWNRKKPATPSLRLCLLPKTAFHWIAQEESLDSEPQGWKGQGFGWVQGEVEDYLIKVQRGVIAEGTDGSELH